MSAPSINVGTGYSVSPFPRASVQASISSGLTAAVSSHAQVNSVSSNMLSSTIPGYVGNGIPGLRVDPAVNPVAQQSMGERMRMIPTLAPAPALFL